MVKLLQPSFGGINLEDIANPKCFYILDTLRAECEIPVWHDDQQGTACVTLAGLINALKVVGKNIYEGKNCTMVGVACNVAISGLFFADGGTPELCTIVDSRGILNKERADIALRKAEYKDKWKLCNTTNAEGRSGGIAEALVGADICVALSQNGPDVIQKEWVSKMAKDSIVSAAPTRSQKCGPGMPRKPGGNRSDRDAATFQIRSTTAWVSPVYSAGRWMSTPRRSPTRCVLLRQWRWQNWPRKTDFVTTTSCRQWMRWMCSPAARRLQWR